MFSSRFFLVFSLPLVSCGKKAVKAAVLSEYLNEKLEHEVEVKTQNLTIMVLKRENSANFIEEL